MKIKYNKKNLSISIVIGILCILLTSGIVVQIRTVQSNISISNPDYANNDLRDQVLKSKEKYDNAFDELEKVNKELEKYRTKVTDNDSSASEKQEELKKDNAILGLNDVTGEGIIVTLDDNKNASVSSVTAGDDISNYLVHEIDLLKIVNELKNAGAIAISINDQRIIPTTSINCAGNITRVNGEIVGTPFVIKAVGGSFDTLERPGGYIDWLREDYGIDITVKKQSNVTVEKYNGVVNFKYAQEAE